MDPRAFLRSLFDAAVAAALPKPDWYAGLTLSKRRTIVVGAGKAAASMARALEANWNGSVEGLVDALVTGPTLTNVDDIRAILVQR